MEDCARGIVLATQKFDGPEPVNLGAGRDFPRLQKEETLPPDPAEHARLAAQLRRHVRRLRSYLQRLGLRSVDEYASRRGRRLCRTR